MHKTAILEIGPGSPQPFGVHECCDGFNFAVFSRHGSRVTLLFFDHPHDSEPCARFVLEPKYHRTGDVWHIRLHGIRHGQAYAWQVDGPYTPEQGQRFNGHKLLVDPHAPALGGTACWDFACKCGFEPDSPHRDLSFSAREDSPYTAKALVVGRRFDWQGDLPLRHPWSDTVIYETHVRGLTVHPSSGVRHPGTFPGLVEKIPYLQELGITAVELMPVQEFNERELTCANPISGERLRNYWGYSTVAFFAPKESYASRRNPGGQITEFKTMVRELHRAGIEVILDVVFNHTAEGDETGPTLNFRGLDNRVYYLLEENRRFYKNYSGCGNTLNCNHPIVRDYILDCLRYWALEMHVDGFRFDLASILGRDEDGHLLPNPPLLERIAEDPILSDVKLIAEAWDAGGAYQVGDFAGRRWSEWNGRYRDDVRRFWRGDPGMVGALASRICGSADLYQHSGKTPVNSINFITCHDGFTLNDLVSYRHKHNQANGEDNRDGADENYSKNYGVEGPTDDPAIEAVRRRQIKNILATLLISRGTPMLLGGDEFRRSQGGNNNAYCQDNELSWYDWTLLQRHREIFRFVRHMIAFRRRHPVFGREAFYTDRDIQWFDWHGGAPQWHGASATLGCLISAEQDNSPYALCLLFNAERRDIRFVPPSPPPGQSWQVAVNTASPPPRDVSEPGGALPPASSERYVLMSRSLAILVSSKTS